MPKYKRRDWKWDGKVQQWVRLPRLAAPDTDGKHCGSSTPVEVLLKVVTKSEMTHSSYGTSTWSLFEACNPEQENQDPVLLLWLHGADMGEIPASDLLGMHRRIGRRTFFLVPMNPKGAEDGNKFFWGIRYSKAQNRNSLGFVFGEIHEPYLDDLAGLVRCTIAEVKPMRVYAFGYSMGGFGVYQIVGHAPDLFDAAVSVAGYGQGTLDPEEVGYRAPQPAASHIFERFLEQHAPRLASVPCVLAVHARLDMESSYNDTLAIVDRVMAVGGHAELVSVPDEMAESDSRSKRAKKNGHRYFNYAFLHETSVQVLYSRLEERLATHRRPLLIEQVGSPGKPGQRPGA